MSAVELRILGAVGRQLSSMPQVRDLEILGKIELALEAIADQTLKFQSMALALDRLIEKIQKATLDSADGLAELGGIFDTALVMCEDYYNSLIAIRKEAAEQEDLDEDDGIIDGLDMLMEQVAAFHNNLSALDWIIGEHIAEMDVTLPGSFSDADALFQAMGV